MMTYGTKAVDVEKVGHVLLLVGSILFLFWFLKPTSVNLGYGDLLFLIGGVLTVYSSSRYLIAPDRLHATGVFIFLSVMSLSVLWTPISTEAAGQIIQHFLIFIIVLPLVITIYQSESKRSQLYVIFYALFSIIILASATEIIFTNPRIDKYRPVVAGLTWGKQNNFHWIVAMGTVFAATFSMSRQRNKTATIFAVLVCTTGTVIVVVGETVSAILALVTGFWLLLLIYIRRRSPQREAVFWLLTATVAVIGLQFIILNWSYIYQEGALYSRIPMYWEAFNQGVAAFPIGRGIGSSAIALDGLPPNIPRSTHSFILHYFMTIGVGVFGLFAILVAWLKNVAWEIFGNPEEYTMVDICFVITFMMYLMIALFQPPPVQRFWWLLFGVAWASVISKREKDTVST